MKLVTFEISTGPVTRLGALSGEMVIDLNSAYKLYLTDTHKSSQPNELAASIVPYDMLAFLKGGKQSLEAAATTLDYIAKKESKTQITGPRGEKVIYDLTEVKLKAPVPRPNSIRDYLAFEGHASRSGQRKLDQAWYEIPVCYRGNPDTVIGPDDVIPWPAYSDLLDYELEYGIYIAKEGKNIPREKAEEYIAGYTILNDISARDIQLKEMSIGLGPVKGKDFCNVMGPCLVTPDEIDPENLRMSARINGEVWSEGNSGTSYWTWPQIIEFASMEETLYPGDFLGSGTVEKGCGAELNRWIQPGDLIELEVEGIGVLRNKVGDKPPRRIFTR